MTPEDFVDKVRDFVLVRAVKSTLSAIKSLPSRRARRELVEANTWYQGLSDEDRGQLRRVAAMVAHQAVFGLFAVLDGARVVEDTADKGDFRLTFRKGNQEWELNPPGGMPLHDILNDDSASDLDGALRMGSRTIRELGGEVAAELFRLPADEANWTARHSVVDVVMGVLARHCGDSITNDEDLPVVPLPLPDADAVGGASDV